MSTTLEVVIVSRAPKCALYVNLIHSVTFYDFYEPKPASTTLLLSSILIDIQVVDLLKDMYFRTLFSLILKKEKWPTFLLWGKENFPTLLSCECLSTSYVSS